MILSALVAPPSWSQHVATTVDDLLLIKLESVLVNAWELVDPIVADPVAQDNDKRNKYKYADAPKFGLKTG